MKLTNGMDIDSVSVEGKARHHLLGKWLAVYVASSTKNNRTSTENGEKNGWLGND